MKNVQKIKFVKRRMLLILYDSLVAVISGLITAIMAEWIYVDIDRTYLFLTIAGVSVVEQFVCLFSVRIYRAIVRFLDSYQNFRLVMAFLLLFVVEGATFSLIYSIWSGSPSYGFKAGMLIACMQVSISFVGVIIGRFTYQFLFSKHFQVRYLRNSAHHGKMTASGWQPAEKPKRVMVIGAGWTGKRVISDLKREERYQPVCLLDDDADKQSREIEDVPVVGGLDKIPEMVKEHEIDAIIFAIPTMESSAKKKVINQCVKVCKEVSVLPNLADLVYRADMMSLLRKVNIDDLLGREVIKFDVRSVSEFINGKVVLITGAGGSIGSELSRQIASYAPKKLILLDVYENGIFEVDRELKVTYGQKLNLSTEIMSITDAGAMDKLFRENGIELIFHAAAHKHVPLMEHNPEESVKNNVVGTYILASTAMKYKARKMVMISTDKAVNPTNVMGATKRFCEKTVNHFNALTEDTQYCAVRFGNVLGSNGSVIHIFNKQIAAGGPVTVTHPDIIRYFMTIPEAVSLVLQAGTYAAGGEVFILDMGEPVRIVNLAENLIRLAGLEPYKDIDIVFSGLRPGEKLFEELLMNEEGIKKTDNRKIFIGNQSYENDENFRTQYKELVAAAESNDRQKTIEALKKAVPTYKPKE